MKAKKKTIESMAVEQLAVDISLHLRTLKITEPPKRQAGVKVKDAADLVNRLRHEAKVL